MRASTDVLAAPPEDVENGSRVSLKAKAQKKGRKPMRLPPIKP
jgi:hypothetical protein